jgi:hypothetical protein
MVRRALVKSLTVNGLIPGESWKAASSSLPGLPHALESSRQGFHGAKRSRKAAPLFPVLPASRTAIGHKSGRQLDTASEQRFQTALPFEPVDHARLERLRADRGLVRATLQAGAGQFIDRRRRAQIAARHELQRIAAGLEGRDASGRPLMSASEHRDSLAAATHAAELQLPDSWLPFVMSR